MLQLTSGLRRIQLVSALPFRIGAILVNPPTRALRVGERAEILEPRVMQTLVALAEADGAVVSRDELIDRCWDGRIVGDNAINRTVSRIRQASAELAPGSLEIETITKVGYRLVGRPQSLPPRVRPAMGAAAAPTRPNRRVVGIGIAGSAAVIVAAAVGWRWRRPSTAGAQAAPARGTATARELYDRGVAAQRLGTADQVVQARAFFEQAVAADPGYADAWGALALSYRHILEGFAEEDRASLPAKIRSSAARALTLDPGNADARLATIITPPYYRHWTTMERALRAFVADHPRHWLGLAQLGLVLQDVDRIDEGIIFQQRVIAIDPFLPVAQALLARAFSLAGRLQECDTTLEGAMRRWPAHPVVWSVRFNSLIFNDRAAEATALVTNPAVRPQDITPALIDRHLLIARAFERRDAADVEHAAAALLAEVAADPSTTPTAAPMLAALGRVDAAFATFDRYFFGDRARRIAPPGRYDRRYTLPLFSPPMRGLTADPRHIALMARTGLDAYYQASASRPDFRRIG